MLTTDFKPSDVKKSMYGSPWKKSEYETIAMNLVTMSRHGHNDQWQDFSWEDYKRFCRHRVIEQELEILKIFASGGYLLLSKGMFAFTHKMVDLYKRLCV